jgi:hypothetical protein
MTEPKSIEGELKALRNAYRVSFQYRLGVVLQTMVIVVLITAILSLTPLRLWVISMWVR